MPNIAIAVDRLSKSYRILHRTRSGGGKYRTLREDLVRLPKQIFRRLGRNDSESRETIWALKDVSFGINEAEVIGIIGRNGAGKSTLLKILSRITEPTSGEARVYGRVGSLLEVGTGFHQELTGRENIFLNGAILGMKRAEIRQRFDEIVSFAEVEKFLDTPVKHYSSGMYVRLAFAVAAHLDPEILIIDEVLAVGDAEFQKKCLGKLGEVARGGRTVLFVSHNMNAVSQLCSRAILINNGVIAMDGPTGDVVNRYSIAGRQQHAEVSWDASVAPATTEFRLAAARLRDAEGRVSSELASDQPFRIEVDYANLVTDAKLGATIILFDDSGTCVFSSISNHDPMHGRKRQTGLFRSSCIVPADLLAEGGYSVTIIVWSGNYANPVREDNVLQLRVRNSGDLRGDYLGAWSGVVRPRLVWQTESIKVDQPRESILTEG